MTPKEQMGKIRELLQEMDSHIHDINAHVKRLEKVGNDKDIQECHKNLERAVWYVKNNPIITFMSGYYQGECEEYSRMMERQLHD